MEKTYSGLVADGIEKPTWEQVLEHLYAYNKGDLRSVIEEISIDHKKIYWLDRHGNEKTTAFATFRDRLTEIKKALR